MAANARSRAASQSTDDGFAPSIFSEADSFTTASTSPPHSCDENDKDHETSEGDASGDFEEISKETFEANVYGTGQGTSKAEDVKVINGSTLGGKDPLHAMVRGTASEPIFWVQDREIEMRRNKRLKRSPSKSGKSLWTPHYFDTLPYSPQDAVSSGLCVDDDPEEDSEEFWGKVSKAWDLSCRYETVYERRQQFEMDLFNSKSATPSPSRFNDELSVV